MSKNKLSFGLLKVLAILVIAIMIFRPVTAIAASKVETNVGISTSNENATIYDDGVAMSAQTYIDETSGQDYYWLFLLILLASGIATEELIRIYYRKIEKESGNNK